MTGRRLISADLDDVVRIERLAHIQPWSRLQFQEDLNREGAALWGAFVADRLAGYVDYWLVPDELQILNIATAPAYQRRGVASFLVEHAVGVARDAKLLRMQLEVRRGNTAAIALYQKWEFRAVAMRPNYYRDLEDALIMIREL